MAQISAKGIGLLFQFFLLKGQRMREPRPVNKDKIRGVGGNPGG